MSTFLNCPLPIHQLVHTHTNRHTLVSFWEDCPHAARVVNILYIDSDFLWQICVVVLVILSKLTVDFSDKWLKLVCIWKRQMQTIYYSFYQRELIIKIAVYPPLCVPLCLFFLISVVKMWKSRNVSRSFSFYIWKITSFFFFFSLNVTFGW